MKFYLVGIRTTMIIEIINTIHRIKKRVLFLNVDYVQPECGVLTHFGGLHFHFHKE